MTILLKVVRRFQNFKHASCLYATGHLHLTHGDELLRGMQICNKYIYDTLVCISYFMTKKFQRTIPINLVPRAQHFLVCALRLRVYVLCTHSPLPTSYSHRWFYDNFVLHILPSVGMSLFLINTVAFP